jgi:hypothetical protein
VARYDGDPTAVTIYTSWNGATDISSYDVYAGPTTTTLTMVENAPRSGFETEILLTGLAPDTCFLQTKPVHAQGNITPFSNITARLGLPICWDQLPHTYMPLIAK